MTLLLKPGQQKVQRLSLYYLPTTFTAQVPMESLLYKAPINYGMKAMVPISLYQTGTGYGTIHMGHCPCV